MIQLSDNDYHIEIANQQLRQFSSEALVSAVAMVLRDYHVASAEISIAVVDDAMMREFNRQYLNHDYETDVLSFLLDETEETLIGQLIISTDTAARVAGELGIEMEHELVLYVIHGTLHLVGLDDTDADSVEDMRAAEREYLHRLGLSHCWPEPDQ
jgi:probable rRNA maturation factor